MDQGYSPKHRSNLSKQSGYIKRSWEV